MIVRTNGQFDLKQTAIVNIKPVARGMRVKIDDFFERPL